MSQTNPSSYRALFKRAEETGDAIERDVLLRIREEYDRNHKTDFAKLESYAASVVGIRCPGCGGENFKKNGRERSGAQRYECRRCGRAFNAVANTPLFASKVNISAWMSFLECLLSGSTVKTACVAAKVTAPTGSSWMGKIFGAIEGYQSPISLGGDVWIDETYVDVNSAERIPGEGRVGGAGRRKKLRGLSRNKICILAATDGGKGFAVRIGNGKPSGAKAKEACLAHIKPGALLIGDFDSALDSAAKELGCRRRQYKAGTPEAHEALRPIDEMHDRFKLFIKKHRGFDKERIQDWTNLFVFIDNETRDKTDLYKVTETLLKMVIKSGFSKKGQ